MNLTLDSLRAPILGVLGVLLFLLIWSVGAPQVKTSLGAFPGPVQVLTQTQALWQEHQDEKDKAAAFYERQEARNAKLLERDPEATVRVRDYVGRPTFLNQIGTSLVTVLAGFVLAAIIAIPIGIAVGLSASLNTAVNPLIQLFKPVSPLAWLPLVTMVVSATYVVDDPLVSKAFVTSMFTVMLCCVWPSIINTAIGVSEVPKDLQNVSKVLRLSAWRHVVTIVLPSAMPMIFTGLRMSLGIAWMVLIAAEMLAQSPGLGKFVWDEFQNGSSESLSRIMVAVLVIGFIGLLLDRGMFMLLRRVSWNPDAVTR